MTYLVENRELLERFRRGDKAVLTEVYRLYAPAVLDLLRTGFSFESKGQRVAFAGERDSCELENFVQEVFARVFAEPARLHYDGLRPFSNYLFAIARNLVADSFRGRSRTFVPFDEAAVEPADAAPERSPVDLIADRQLDTIITSFRAALSPFDASVFAARFAEGLSVEAAARRLGVTEYRVKRTEQQLRKRFFALMLRHGYLEGRDVDEASLAVLLPLLMSLAAGGLR